MNGLHYIVCSMENMFDVVQSQLLLRDNNASVSSTETDSDILTAQNLDSPIQAFYVPSILTTRLPDCMSQNYTSFLYCHFLINVPCSVLI